MSREGSRKWSENVYDGSFVRFTTRWQNGTVSKLLLRKYSRGVVCFSGCLLSVL